MFLGCFFAPLLTFFIVTGALQTFDLHEDHKDGYVAPKILSELSEVHMHQQFSDSEESGEPSFPFKIFVLAMSAGLFLSVILGVIMAFRYTKKRIFVWLCLAAGIILPVLFLVIAHRG